ncbi:MAG: hypothetical protein ACYCOU_03190 [Sulfobacillus sp.]
MTEIREVYGPDYQEDCRQQQVDYAVDILAKNLSKNQLKFRFDNRVLWSGGRLQREHVSKIVKKIDEFNRNLRVDHLDTPESRSMLPYFLPGEVEYFRLVDFPKKKIYLVAISPDSCEAY